MSGTRIQYSLCDEEKTFEIYTPHINELPNVCSKTYVEFFTKRYLSFPNFIDVLYWFMAQVGSVVVTSTCTHKIAITTEVLRTIIFPFEYDDPYILALPRHYTEYLTAPFPCLMGMKIATYHESVQLATIAASKTLVVNLDSGDLFVNYEQDALLMAEFKKRSEIVNEEKCCFKNKCMPLSNKVKDIEKLINSRMNEFNQRKNVSF